MSSPRRAPPARPASPRRRCARCPISRRCFSSVSTAAATSAPVLAQNGVFCVNTLGAGEEKLADLFAGRSGVHLHERFSHGRMDHVEDRRAGARLRRGRVRLPHHRNQGGRPRTMSCSARSKRSGSGPAGRRWSITTAPISRCKRGRLRPDEPAISPGIRDNFRRDFNPLLTIRAAVDGGTFAAFGGCRIGRGFHTSVQTPQNHGERPDGERTKQSAARSATRQSAARRAEQARPAAAGRAE